MKKILFSFHISRVTYLVSRNYSPMNTWQKLRNDPNLWPQYFIRQQVIKGIRSFLDKQEFHEVETPLLVVHPPAESYVDVFETTLLDRQRKKTKAYLSTSPEVALKKLLVAGIGNCYSLTKSFRNMEMQSKTHNPEFTILEWYRVNADYTDIMTDCEQLLLYLLTYFKKDTTYNLPLTTLNYQGHTLDLTPPWPRITVRDAFKKWAHIDFDDFFKLSTAQHISKQKGYTVTQQNTWEELYDQIYLNEIEPHLGVNKPTIIYEFPASLAALSQKKKSDPRYAERFEFYIGGLELGDCYSELTDWKEQETRFQNELKELQRLGKTTYEYDHDFIKALQTGMPKTSGIAIGVDRLVMLLADVNNIADTLFFPIQDLMS